MPAPIRFTIDQLLVLEATARLGSFSKAAKELYRVPSAVTYTVKSLEDALSLELFDRSGQRAILTPTGRRILEEAKSVLNEGERLQRLATQMSDGWESELRIVVDGVLPMRPITNTLASIHVPDVPTRIRLDVEYQEGVIKRFLSDRCDIMLCLDIVDNDPRIERRSLPDLEIVLVCSAEHPLSKLETIQKEQLEAHIELLVKDSSPQYIEQPKPSYLGSRHIVYLSDFHSKKEAILAGVGFGWLPRGLIQKELSQNLLHILNYEEGASWTYHPQIVTWKNTPLGRAGTLFLKQLIQHIQNN